MNNDKLLGFFYETISNNQLFEKTEIKYFWKNKIIKNKDINILNVNVTKAIVSITIETGEILLIEDYLLNFLISYTIIVGESANLIQFQSNNQKYICEKTTFDKIKTKFNISNTSIINPIQLFQKNFKINYKQIPLITELKDYVKNNKNLDLNQIHIVQGFDVENFIPTIRQTHLKIAKNMSIPVISLIENDFLIDTNINIYDTLSQQKIINPISTETINEKREFDNNLNLLYKNISKEFYLNIDKNQLSKKISNIKKTNIPQDKILKIISKINKIQLTNNNGEIYAPLWKTQNEGKIIPLPNKQSFIKLTGVKYKDEILKNIYIQNDSGDVGKFQNKFITNELKITLEEENFNKITFNSDTELILKLILSENPLEIIEIENISENKIKEFTKNTKILLNELIKYEINKTKTNKIEEFEIYLESISQTLTLEINSYNQIPSQKKLIENISKLIEYIAINLISISKNVKINIETLKNITYCCIQISKNIDKKNCIELENEFNSYFKNYKISTPSNQIDYSIISFFNNLAKLKEFQKTKKCIIEIKKEFNKKLIPDVDIMDKRHSHKTYRKPNYPKLKSLFQYSYKEVISQLKDNNKDFIELKNKKIPIKEDFFIEYNIYDNYKLALENEYFSLFFKI